MRDTVFAKIIGEIFVIEDVGPADSASALHAGFALPNSMLLTTLTRRLLYLFDLTHYFTNLNKRHNIGIFWHVCVDFLQMRCQC
ncbi:hypothetical protein PMI41_02823 [Phyllobacterium sp. YR531]|nr:hypothetical protein PMI41_02823 [Phyllobacterium sp. YR531]